MSERPGTVLGRVAAMPAAGVSDRGEALGRDGASPPTTGVPLIGVSVREDGGGGRIDGTPLDGVSERGTTLARDGSAPTMGVPLTGVRVRLGVPLAGVRVREGGVLGRDAVVEAALKCTAGMPLIGVSERGGALLERDVDVGATLVPAAGTRLPTVPVAAALPVVVLGVDVTGSVLAAAAGLCCAAALVLDLAGCTNAAAVPASAGDSSAPQSSSMSSVFGTTD